MDNLTKKEILEEGIKKTKTSFSNLPSGCYIHVYTGNGAGKTTSSLGVALRSVGHDKKVVVIQFLKGRGEEFGEFKIQKKLAHYSVYQFGRDAFLDKGEPSDDDKKLAKKGLLFAKKVIEKQEVDLLILDEINLTVYYGLLTIEETLSVLNVAKKQKRNLDIYLTGRYCPKELMDFSDFVTEINTIKRPSEFLSRKGIEF